MFSTHLNEANNCGDTPQEWLRRLTVKIEKDVDNAPGVCTPESVEVATTKEGESIEGISIKGDDVLYEEGCEDISKRRKRKKRKKEKKENEKDEKPSKEECLIIPKDSPVYTPALATSQLPYGASQVVKTGEDSFSTSQLQLLGLTGSGATGLWRLHAKSGINYRRGQFTEEERIIIEEALKQYTEREGLSSVEEAIECLLYKKNKTHTGQIQIIARCLPDRPLISIYGYLRRRIIGNIKRGVWTDEETQQLIKLIQTIPPSFRGRWVRIGRMLNRKPADVCDRFRTIQHRLHHQYLINNEDKDYNNIYISKEDINNKEIETSEYKCNINTFNTQHKIHLLKEIQEKTGEELPSFGIPWQIIRTKYFPWVSHRFIRHYYCWTLLPEELEKRMKVAPKPIILRHVLRCIGRLHIQQKLPTALRGIEWLDILPFVPSLCQQTILNEAVGPIIREKKISIEVAVVELIEKYKEILRKTRRKDAARLLRGVLPVYIQQNIENKIKEKARIKHWKEYKIKKKIKKKIRVAAAEELERLKHRLAKVRASPLNAPPRGCPRFIQEEKDKYNLNKDNNILFDDDDDAADAADDDGVDRDTATLLSTPFTNTGIVDLMNKEKNKRKEKNIIQTKYKYNTEETKTINEIIQKNESVYTPENIEKKRKKKKKINDKQNNIYNDVACEEEQQEEREEDEEREEEEEEREEEEREEEEIEEEENKQRVKSKSRKERKETKLEVEDNIYLVMPQKKKRKKKKKEEEYNTIQLNEEKQEENIREIAEEEEREIEGYRIKEKKKKNKKKD